MKLKEIHLFLILLGVLLLSNLGFIIKEGLNPQTQTMATQADDAATLNAAAEDAADEREALDDTAGSSGFYKNSPPDELNDTLNGEPATPAARGGNRDMEVAAAAGTLATPANAEKEGLASDQYILKSSIVPPVCPKCPDVNAAEVAADVAKKSCPPCPACARCPEQPFTCKKVPDYKNIDSKQLPKPVLTNFSKFSS